MTVYIKYKSKRSRQAGAKANAPRPRSSVPTASCFSRDHHNMHRSKAFFKKTRKGKILRVVADHYLRDDIGCGSLAGKPVSTVRTVL